MIVNLAGYVSELMLNEYVGEQKKHMSISHSFLSDFEHAVDNASYRFGNNEEVNKYMDNMVEATKDSLLAFWLHVVVLAIVLLDKKHINYDDVIYVLEKLPLS